ncbi:MULTISPECIES: sugar ABC transporter substrate-binding protein [Microbacterium]|uniref:ABC transporter substrate-binding protein n=1 Tax=Microbacterium TaxID=33882 RepID=UPI000CFAD0EF|nr:MULTISPECIES: sugar ABC transporter substrate-binding protein [unclassified Microbacterium]PRB11210.1 ABC transporter substrate-binding protein [Microbacterium sp. MYb72]
MRTRTAAVALVAATALVLAGCSGGGSGEQSGDRTVTFMGWGSPQEVDVFKDMIAQYEKKYPGVKVDYISVPAADFQTKLQTMIAAKKTPDVFYMVGENLQPLVKNGVIADLSDYVADNEIFDADNVWKNAIDLWKFDGTTPGQGAIYALPKDIGPFALAYNKDLFAAAGIPDPDPEVPWTWDEFVANAKKLTSGEGADKTYGTAPYSLESAVWSNDADWLNADHTKVSVTDPKFVEALQWVADLSLKEGVAPSSEEESSLGSFQRFIDGKIGMMGIGPWSQGQFWDEVTFDWDLMPWPVPTPTSSEATWYGGVGFAVSKASKNPTDAENLAAFLAFNEDAQRTNMEKGQAVPNLIDMTNDEYLTMDKPPANKQQFIRIIEEVGHRPTQTFTYNGDWWNVFSSNVASVYRGEVTAAEYTKSVEAEMQTALDDAIATAK